MRKSDGISLALFLASFPSLALATSQACLTVCLGLQSTQFLTYDRLTGTPVTVNYVWPAPAWFQGGWVENHLAPACDAWRVGVTVPGVDYDAFDTTPNVIVIFETAGWVYPGALAVTEPSGPAYGWTAQKNIHVDTFEHEALDWFTGGGTPPGGIDLQTVLIHEIGHALGLGGDVSSVFSQCTVMTGTYLGANRATKGLDQAAINCYYGPVPVGDIQNFSVQGSSHNVNLSFEIQGGANPNEYAAVYVSDNPMGPARLIDLLTDHAVVMPDSNDWVDSYRLAPAGSYVYWLDYNAYPGVNVLRPPDGLYPATGWGTVTGPAQPTIDPPDIYLASDAPYDLGGSIELFFYQSTDEAQADYYNIYRNMYPPGQPQEGEWRYLASIDAPANGYYLDEHVVANWVTQYKISAAHHGNYSLQAGRANEGIWNAMSEQVTTTAINNFWSDQITLVSDDTLRVCPAGQDGTLEVDVVMWGSNIAPTPAIPPYMIECYPVNESAKFCDGVPYLNPDEPTDEFGRAALTTSAIGGHGKTDLIFGLWNSPLRFDTLTVYLKSPDVDGSGTVNVADFSAFAMAFTSPPKEYKWYLDFTTPFGTITLQDFGYFSTHNTHTCGGGNLVMAKQSGQSNATVQVGLAEVVSPSSRLLHADISVADLSSFKAALFHLRTDNPMLEFQAWEKGSFPGRVLATPVVRDGVKEFAIGVLDGEDFRGQAASLGRIVFRIDSNEDLALTPRDFETRTAEVLSTSDAVLRMNGTASEATDQVQRIVGDGLAQNRPNPFNPTTTLSYSVSQQGRVTLRVFGVDGSLVRTLVDRDQQADRYDVQWDGTDGAGQRVASGVYFYTLKTPLFTSTKKMVLLK